MASNGEIDNINNPVTSGKQEASHKTKHHRVGKTAQNGSKSGGSNRVVSNRRSPVSSDVDDQNCNKIHKKSRTGKESATKALSCTAADKKAGKKSSKSSKSDSHGDGSIVDTPATGQVSCEQERSTSRSVSSGDEKCHDKPYRHIPQKCVQPKEKWQNGEYCRDDCGSGIVAKKLEFKHARPIWCKTPLSMYQATIGELGKQILCAERVVPRDVKPGPPCNICEYVLPPCRGYYRKYDCIRPCEEEHVSYHRGRKLYRDRVERYWEPCLSKDQRVAVDINTFAHQNAFLGAKLRRQFDESTPCW